MKMFSAVFVAVLAFGGVLSEATDSGSLLCELLQKEVGISSCYAEKLGTGYVIEAVTDKKAYGKRCESSMLVPAEGMWSRPLRGFLYILCLLYSFAGINIVADRFMLAIERITTRRHFKPVVDPETGTKSFVVKSGWNDTIAALTLMAIGTSAPEILITFLETIKTLGQPADELGPGTVVGSAAYNFLIITALCIIAVPAGRVTRITNYRTFIYTAFVSIWAYIWTLIILKVITPGRIDVWEALLTLAHQPVFVYLAYEIDTDFARWRRRAVPLSLTDIHASHVRLPSENWTDVTDNPLHRASNYGQAQEGSTALTRRSVFANQDRIKFHLAALERINRGRGKRWKMNTMEAAADHDEVQEIDPAASSLACYIKLQLGREIVKTNVRTKSLSPKFQETFALHLDLQSSMLDINPRLTIEVVNRYGPLNLEETLSEGEVPLAEYLAPPSNNLTLQSLQSVDGDLSPEDGIQHGGTSPGSPRHSVPVALRSASNVPYSATATQDPEAQRQDSDSPLQSGSKPRKEKAVRFNFKTAASEPDSAYSPPVPVMLEVPLISMTSGQHQGVLNLSLTVVKTSNQTSLLLVTVLDAQQLVAPTLPDAPTGPVNALKKSAVLRRVKTMRRTVQKKLTKSQEFWTRLSRAWSRDMVEALTLETEEDENGSSIPPSPLAMLNHVMMLPWKAMFTAIIPPPDADGAGGWLSFWVALGCIAAVCVIVGEIAKLFGCVVGLSNYMTGVSIVAMGTSVPDTLASMIAAKQSPVADAAIGNITGSNSSNIFLGLGLAWSAASIYCAATGKCTTSGPGANGYVSYFEAKAPGLVSGVVYFTIFAGVGIALLQYRRKVLGGELGGPRSTAYMHAGGLIALWLIYLVLVGTGVWNI